MSKNPYKVFFFLLFLLSASLFLASPSFSQAADDLVSSIPSISQIQGSKGPQDVVMSLKMIFLLTVFSLAPSIIIMTTSFARVAIVLNFTRRALSTQDTPPNQVMMGLALFLTFFVMAPTIAQIKEQAWDPYVKKDITTQEAYGKAIIPLREFMFRQTREEDLRLFINLSNMPAPNGYDDIPIYLLIPSFMISELHTAFIMGTVLFIPFIVIDMVIASTLMSMGMIMVPPVLISLPFKIMIFTLVNGWELISFSIIKSYNIG